MNLVLKFHTFPHPRLKEHRQVDFTVLWSVQQQRQWQESGFKRELQGCFLSKITSFVCLYMWVQGRDSWKREKLGKIWEACSFSLKCCHLLELTHKRVFCNYSACTHSCVIHCVSSDYFRSSEFNTFLQEKYRAELSVFAEYYLCLCRNLSAWMYMLGRCWIVCWTYNMSAGGGRMVSNVPRRRLV